MKRINPSYVYIIETTAEECHCKFCGVPLYIGDSVVCLSDDTFCSAGCADRFISYQVLDPQKG